MNGSRHSVQYVQFPEEVTQMMLEIFIHHPELQAIVQAKPDINEVLAEVGAYLGLAMDGQYDIRKTCDDFYFKLRAKRTSIILPVSLH